MGSALGVGPFFGCTSDADVVSCIGGTGPGLTGLLTREPEEIPVAGGAASLSHGSAQIPDSIARIAVAGGAACALGVSGQIYCWGSDLGLHGHADTVGPVYLDSIEASIGVAPQNPPPLNCPVISGHRPVDRPHSNTCVVSRDGDLLEVENGSVDTDGFTWDRATATITASPAGAERGEIVFTDGNTTVRAAYDFRSDGPVVDELATGNTHVCARSDTGAVRCWGYNVQSQCGAPASQTHGASGVPADAAPVPISGLATKIDAGFDHTCAVVNPGQIQCWGANDSLQLGSAAIDSNGLGPILSASPGARAVAAGRNHSCALLNDGSVVCWGSNNEGQLGNRSIDRDSTVDFDSRVGPQFQADVVRLVSHESHSCALLVDGSAVCWGENRSGQLGVGSEEPFIGDDEVVGRFGEHLLHCTH